MWGLPPEFGCPIQAIFWLEWDSTTLALLIARHDSIVFHRRRLHRPARAQGDLLADGGALRDRLAALGVLSVDVVLLFVFFDRTLRLQVLSLAEIHRNAHPLVFCFAVGKAPRTIFRSRFTRH